MSSKTLFDKIWDSHVVNRIENGPEVLYIDRHFIHEVTSLQAFNGLRTKDIPVFRPAQTITTADRNVPTQNQHLPIADRLSEIQESNPVQQVKMSPDNQAVALEGSDLAEVFDIDLYKKYCLMQGFNDIDFLLNPKTKIEAYEARHR